MTTRKPAPTVESYAKVNAECARIILDDPVRHINWPEPMTNEEISESLAVVTARRVIEQAKEQAK